MKSTLMNLSLVLVLGLSFNSFGAENDQPYRIENSWLTLGDGVRLAVTYYVPDSVRGKTQFPLLLEMLPYRKDDLAKSWAHPLYDYFARQGLALAKVDVRGTGSSEGVTPTREYSNQEINDAIEIIDQLAELPFSNGNVGMWGISWGGFNAIQVALKNPPQLKAILAAHASDDLYSNDVHYTDGIFGVDEYILSINHMNGFMRSPEYSIDANYFFNRFDQTPWLFNYLKHSVDGPFWREGSLKYQMQNLNIPVYLIGGLLDGYRDTLPNTLENSQAPVRAVLGPWPHAWPNSASPGPTWEWRDDAAAWWHAHLGDDSSLSSRYQDNDFRIFVRSGNEPDPSLSQLDGDWYNLPWPVPASDSNQLILYPTAHNQLVTEEPNSSAAFLTLEGAAGTGIDLGEWWGELLPDMQATDAYALVFDSEPLQTELVVIGKPSVSLMAASNTNSGNWVVRLEDVGPDGSVALITGGAINSQLRHSTAAPETIQANTAIVLSLPLRMTSWTFKPGHKIRLAVSNGAFPMFWPSPSLTRSELEVDTTASSITLPLWQGKDQTAALTMSPGGLSNYLSAEVIALEPVPGHPSKREVIRDAEANTISLIRESGASYQLKGASIQAIRHTRHTTANTNPANTEYEGWAEYVLEDGREGGPVHYRTEISLVSDAEFFDLDISRILSNDAGEIRRQRWQEKIPRGAQ